ncbi:alkaline phosphatase family protein [uncultured Shewanella sp.]|uniref:alkaline phosphatase family protein n=1 Tax=uncultured Shewanella sp. TaxID=173975 RepID=UPI002616695B|nr:alkaline phosphatase family protein [uncultured Shewanella sp.]
MTRQSVNRLVVFNYTLILCLLITLTFKLHAQSHTPHHPILKKPKLILQITVDALRGDLLNRYQKNLSKEGFNRLINNGITYTNAHYQHANTETIVGHASLATGAPPAIHGMIGNIWFDRNQNRVVYNIEDPHYGLLTKGGGVDPLNEIDPTQKAAKNEGRSPIALLTSTISDEIAIANPHSKIFAISIKDRGAVSFAGQYGKAFWFSKTSATFVTSNYYYQNYPDWIEQWNERRHINQYHDQQWKLNLPENQYLHANENVVTPNTNYKTDIDGFGTRFPHSYGKANDKSFTTKLTLGPAGDTLTALFAKALLENEQLGQDDTTDYLSISFSSNDYVLHLFGPSSLEAEDNLLKLDQTLANLFHYIDKQIGFENTLIILSADHGAPEVPQYLKLQGNQKAHYFSPKLLSTPLFFSNIEKQLKLNKGQGKTLVQRYAHPYLYLNYDQIKKNKLDIQQAQDIFATEIRKLKGVAYAIPSHQIALGALPKNHIMTLINNNYHRSRSGDIHLIFSPQTFINELDGLEVASMHGSPWQYDTFVPIIFAGSHLQTKTVNRAVTPYSIAPTIAAYLGITPPSGTSADRLREVLYRQ